MRTIWKFRLSVDDRPSVSMPSGARILSVQMQGDEMCLWAEVESDHETEQRCFRVFGTGHEMPRDMGYHDEYVGTVQMGRFVWHVYEQL